MTAQQPPFGKVLMLERWAPQQPKAHPPMGFLRALVGID